MGACIGHTGIYIYIIMRKRERLRVCYGTDDPGIVPSCTGFENGDRPLQTVQLPEIIRLYPKKVRGRRFGTVIGVDGDS